MKQPVPTVMSCDVLGCLRQPRRAPRIVVPSSTPLELEHPPIRIMTLLHYCDEHRNAFSPATYWTDKEKRRVEDYARKHRPLGFKPEFEGAFVEMVLVTTPEYRQFLKDMGLNVIAA